MLLTSFFYISEEFMLSRDDCTFFFIAVISTISFKVIFSIKTEISNDTFLASRNEFQKQKLANNNIYSTTHIIIQNKSKKYDRTKKCISDTFTQFAFVYLFCIYMRYYMLLYVYKISINGD